jgi:3-deoxy-D-arabino-heptulosonate 7-phosphate (DAHP) synthase class II
MMAKTTRAMNSIPAAVRAEVKRLRSELAIISDNKAQIVQTANRMFDRDGYDAAREARFDATMAQLASDRQAILDKIDALLGKTAAHAAA